MKTLLYTLLSLFCFVSCLMAQERPVFLPEDIESNRLSIKCLCQPGVENKSPSRGLEFSYYNLLGNEIENDGDPPFQPPLSKVKTLEGFIFKLKIPFVNKEAFKLLGGVSYRPEIYRFRNIGSNHRKVFASLDGKPLNSAGFEIIAVNSWNEKIYTAFRLRNLYNGDYQDLVNFSEQYAIYNFSAILGIKKNDNFEYAIGLNVTKSFRNTLALPFIVYNRNFNEKWGIESILPAMILLRYNLRPSTVFLTGFRYNSRSYSITVPETDLSSIYNFNHSEIRILISMDQQIQPWVWFNLETGFQRNFSTDFELKGNPDGDFNVELRNSPYMKVGIFLSPPRKP